MQTTGFPLIWEQFRDELRSLRGQGVFRGTEVHLPLAHRIVLTQESRGARMAHGKVILHLTEPVFAEQHPGGPTLYLRDYHNDIRSFLTEVLQWVRGDAYIRSSSEKADYRKS